MATILVIDDDELTLKSINHQLTIQGHQIFVVDNGIDALEIIQTKNPDLIISDVLMPGMDGLTLLNILKQFYFNKIPVIFISSIKHENTIIKSLNLGAADFMVKPINFEEMNNNIKKYKI